MVKDLQVVLGAEPFVAAFAESIERQAEPRRREQVVAIGVIRERPRLADQRVDDVPVVHRRALPADQSGEGVDVFVRVPDLDPVGEQPGLDPLADQPAVHRVGVAVNVNQTAGIDPASDLQARRQPGLGQPFERRDFLGEPVRPTGVADGHDLPQERPILVPAGEVAAAAKPQRLVDGRFEVPVRRFRVAVLVRLSGVGPLACHAVMGQQIAVPGLELPRRRQVVHRRTQGVAAVPPRHPAQLPERVLQPVR
jgi:hypothetical protein